MVIAAVAALVACALGAAVYLSLLNQKPTGYDKNSPAYQRLEAAKKAVKPTDEIGRMHYYSDLAYAYEELGDTKNALDNFLLADQHLQKSRFKDGMTFNVSIAMLYKELGDEKNAESYYQREIDWLRTNPETKDSSADLVRRLQADKEAL